MGIQDRQLTAAVKNLGQYTRTVLGRVEYNENAAGKSQGKAETIACRTCKAPADPPTTIMSLRPMALPSRVGYNKWGVRQAQLRSAG